MAPKKEKKVNELGVDPRALTVAQKRELFLKKKKSLAKDWHVVKKDDRSDLIPYNFIVLDYVLKLFGMPGRGHVIQFHGDEGSTKSSLGYCVTREYQRFTGEPVVIFDFERTATSEYLQSLGLDLDMVMLIQPDDVEKATIQAIEFMNDGVRFFMFDSIPRMKTMIPLEDIKEGKAFGNQPGQHANTMSKFWDAILPHIARVDGRILAINQTRSRVEMTQEAASAVKYATVTNLNYTLPGGKATRYAVGTMVEMSKKKAWKPGKHEDDFVLESEAKNGEEYIALEIKVRSLKGKSGGNGYRQGTIWYRQHKGIDEDISVRDYARQLKLIFAHGKRWVVGESVENPIKIYDDKASAINALVDNPDYDVLGKLRALVIEKLRSTDEVFDMDEEEQRYLAGESVSELDENGAPITALPVALEDDEL